MTCVEADKVANIKRIFESNLSCDGTLGFDEFANLLRNGNRNMATDHIRLLFNTVQQDGRISFDAFVDFVFEVGQEVEGSIVTLSETGELKGVTRASTEEEGAYEEPLNIPMSPSKFAMTLENREDLSKKTNNADRFKQAVEFFQSANNSELWTGIVPKLLRVETIKDEEYLVLENIMADMESPVIADFKLGFQSWFASDSPEKIAKKKALDAESTTEVLGFRVSSAMLPHSDAPSAGYMLAGRTAVKKGLAFAAEGDWRAAQTQADVGRIVGMFLRTPELRKAFKVRLQPFIHVFQTQTEMCFNVSHFLVGYDHSEGPNSLCMRLMNFGRVCSDANVQDENTLKALMNLDALVDEVEQACMLLRRNRSSVADEFAGGHAENRVAMEDEFEFAKTHAVPERFEKEVNFLRFANATEVWIGIAPKFIRVETIEDRQFMVLENMLGGMTNPVIADFKLGTQSWEPGASSEKISKMQKRDAGSTTPSLGVRVVSAMIPQGSGPSAGYLSSGRVAVKGELVDESDWRAAQTQDDVTRILHTFLGNDSVMLEAFKAKLQPVISLFQEQTEYHFIGSSLLVCYDHCKGPASLNMRLIDFGHAHAGQNKIDEGVLKGLVNLMKLADATL